MPKYEFSPLAKVDLEDIWDFIAQDNTTAASKFILKLSEKFNLLASNPLMGVAREEIDLEYECSRTNII